MEVVALAKIVAAIITLVLMITSALLVVIVGWAWHVYKDATQDPETFATMLHEMKEFLLSLRRPS